MKSQPWNSAAVVLCGLGLLLLLGQIVQPPTLSAAAPSLQAITPEPYLVKDINPGTSSSTFAIPMTNVNDTLFFAANDGTHGAELWKSDGTEDGTVMVKDINPGSGYSTPASEMVDYWVDVNGVLYFIATDGVHGSELWRSDGTEAGTTMVKDIAAGSYGALDAAMQLCAIDSTLFFKAVESTYGSTVWKSDGTEAGTASVAGIELNFLGGLKVVNDTLFFTGDDEIHGIELWKSDGTAAGTVMVKDINIDPTGAGPEILGDVNGVLYFVASDETVGRSLWRSDGTTAGTVMVKDVCPFPYGGGQCPFNPIGLPAEVVNDVLYFPATDGVHGSELWRSDGTADGTVMVKDIEPGSDSPLLSNLINVNGVLYFTDNLAELWKSDGTLTGTVKLRTFISANPYGYAYITDLIEINGKLYFSANDGTGWGIWTSDGTAAGTVKIAAIGASRLTNVNGKLFFYTSDSTHGSELWVLPPTASLAINYPDGQPGSYFTLTGQAFPANATASIFVNGQSVGTHVTDSAGDLAFQLHTAPQAEVGPYLVTVKVNPEASVKYTLDAAAPLRAAGSGTIIEVPAEIRPPSRLYLPLVVRN